MAIKLPRFTPFVQIADENGNPSVQFIDFWGQLARAVEMRQPAIPDLPLTASLSDVINAHNALLAALRVQGVIST